MYPYQKTSLNAEQYYANKAEYYANKVVTALKDVVLAKIQASTSIARNDEISTQVQSTEIAGNTTIVDIMRRNRSPIISNLTNSEVQSEESAASNTHDGGNKGNCCTIM